jgi:hypothetical protein
MLLHTVINAQASRNRLIHSAAFACEFCHETLVQGQPKALVFSSPLPLWYHLAACGEINLLYWFLGILLTTDRHAALRLIAPCAIHSHSLHWLLFRINGVHRFSPRVRLLASNRALERLPTPFSMLLCTDFSCCCFVCVVLH